MKYKLLNMLQLQDQLNRHINPHWLQANNEWYRAIWLESAELMEHYGWKWWKAQEHDMEQIRLELIDIWHFGLSAELVSQQGDHGAAADKMLEQLQEQQSTETDFCANVDQLARFALEQRALDMPAFLSLLAAVDSSFDDLYRIYVGKNVLNRFRQDHGYKSGSYIKTWQNREDNEHLVEITTTLDAEAADFEQQIYTQLTARYPGT
ncbi:dUTP diphosphatase [Thiolapillus sp.]